jgi:nucleoside-diphosphate-sugar epimerase
MRILILGGTGVISRAIVEELLKNHHEVSIFNRATRRLNFNNEIEQITGDRKNYNEFEALMKKRRFDIVIDMICFNEEDAKSTLRAFQDNVEQIIITSSTAAYKRPFQSIPVIEELEQLTEDKAFKYSFDKAEMERYLCSQIQQHNMPITIVRPSLTYGIGAENIGVLRQNYGIIDRIKKGKPLVMFGDGTTPWSFTFAPDLAKGYAGLVGNKSAYGEAYHITSDEVHIWEDLYIEFGRIIGKEPNIVHISSELLRKASPVIFDHLYYEKSYSGIYNNSKIKRDVHNFKAEISLEKGLKTIVQWFEEENKRVDPLKDELEDKLVNLHTDWSKQIEKILL